MIVRNVTKYQRPARAAGRRESYKAEAEINAIAERHGLSLDWIFGLRTKAA
jgi:hypothetical protein